MKSTSISPRKSAHFLYRTFVFVLGFVAIFLPLTAVAANTNSTNKNKKTKTLIASHKNVATKKINSATSPAKSTAASSTVLAKNADSASTKMNRAPAGISDSDKSLEIRGQSRNLSMLLVLKNRHENIDFVKPRDSYREEIQKTGF